MNTERRRIFERRLDIVTRAMVFSGWKEFPLKRVDPEAISNPDEYRIGVNLVQRANGDSAFRAEVRGEEVVMLRVNGFSTS